MHPTETSVERAQARPPQDQKPRGRHDLLGGAGWGLLGFAITRGITFIATLVLARLLDPADFGLAAVAMLIVTTLSTVGGLGLGGAIVLAERDRALLGSTLAVLMLAGAGGAAAVALAAGLVSELFDLPRLQGVLAALSLMLMIGAVTTFYDAVLQRELRFRSRFFTQLVQGITYTAVSIAAAAAGAGVWSLVAGQLVSAGALGLSLFILAPYHVMPRLRLRDARRAVAYGRGFLAQTVLVVLQRNVDVAAAAYVLGARAAGHYSMAYGVANIPYAAFTQPVATAAFPVFAQAHRRGQPTSELCLELLEIVAFIAWPAGILLSATADPFVGAILGSKWHPTGGPLAVLGLWSAVVQIEAALGWFMNSTGAAGINAAVCGAATALLLPAVILGAEAGGIVGIAWAMLAGAVVTAFWLMLCVRRRAELPVRRQLAVLDGIAVASAAAWISARLVLEAVSGMPDSAALLLASAIGLTSYFVVLQLIRPATLRRGMHSFGRTIASIRGSDSVKAGGLVLDGVPAGGD